MKAARLDKSERLQRVVRLLSSGREFSTMEIVSGACVMAVNSAVAELREQGFEINCQRRGDYWYYSMATDKASLSARVGL